MVKLMDQTTTTTVQTTAEAMVWHCDGGHEWLRLSVASFPDAAQFGSGYGYRTEGAVLLEGDCEVSAFVAAHPELEAAVRGAPEVLHETRAFLAGMGRLERAAGYVAWERGLAPAEAVSDDSADFLRAWDIGLNVDPGAGGFGGVWDGAGVVSDADPGL